MNAGSGSGSDRTVMDAGSGVLTIIVNFNMGVLVERCLESMQQPSDPFIHHVVVWENGTERSIGGKPLGSEWKAGQSLVWYTGGEGNLGYARGVNTAYRRWLARVTIEPAAIHCANPDTLSESETLPRLVRRLKQQRWGAIAPLVTFDHGGSRPAAYPPLTPALVVAHFLRLRWMRRHGQRLQPTTPPRVVPGAIDGAFIVFDGKAWKEVGGLDEYFGISTDDHDVCNRLRKAGWVVGVDPSVSVAHNGAAGRSEAPLLSQMDEIQGSIRYVSKYYPLSLPLVRAALWGLLRMRREPLSKELAWWARHAPPRVDHIAPDMEDNFRHALRAFPDRAAAVLTTRLAAEGLRRRSSRNLHREPIS